MDRQKLLMIFGGAFVAAALLTWFLYSQTVAPKKDKMVTVLAATADLPAGTRVQKVHLKKIAIPQATVRELIALRAGRGAASVAIEGLDEAPVIRLRGRLLPLVFLGGLLGIDAAVGRDEGAARGTVVVVRVDEREFGLVVDGVTVAEEIVVKPIVAALTAGVVWPLAVRGVVGPARSWLVFVLAAATAGAWVFTRLQGRVEGWRVAIAGLAGLILYSVVR